MQEPVYVLHLNTCHGRIMPRFAELLLNLERNACLSKGMFFHVSSCKES